MVAEMKMPGKRMCVSRGQDPIISPYPWIPEKADLMAGQGQNWELIAAASRLGMLRALFSGFIWLSWERETAWDQEGGAGTG